MITTNTGAKKLESSDNWREIFPNSDLGTAGAHNASVDAADRIQPEIAPIINGKQCALGAAKGDYVLLRNSTITGKTDGAYVAAKAIPANTDIDSTYLGSAITGGISNELNSKITKRHILQGTLMNNHRDVAYGSFYRSYIQEVSIAGLGITNIEYVNITIMDGNDGFAVLLDATTSAIKFLAIGATSISDENIKYYIEVIGS